MIYKRLPRSTSPKDNFPSTTMPAKLRLRHPKGVSTLTLDLDAPDATVQDLLNQIFSVSEIMPSQQDLKIGYPPTVLEAVVPELPLSSLGIKSGDQIMVTQKTGAPPINSNTRPTALQPPLPSGPHGVNTSSPTSSSTLTGAPTSQSGPENVSVDGGYLIHRVSRFPCSHASIVHRVCS